MRRLPAILVAALLAAGLGTAGAQLRTVPADAKRGTLGPLQGMTVTLDGRTIELAAGAQIRDAENRIVLPTALPANQLVKYQLAADGKLFRAWILTPQEAAQPDAK